jgi:hypothetical protein
MEDYKIDLNEDITEQINELCPKSQNDFTKLYNEVYDNCIDTLYMDECGQVWSRGIYIAKCKL